MRSQCRRCGEPVAARDLCAYHYAKTRMYLHAIGQFESRYVDNTATVEHVRALRAAGVGLPRIAELSGLTRMTVDHIADTRIHVMQHVEAAILSVPIPTSPIDPVLADGAQVDSTGSRRRLQALNAIGWSRPYIVTALGLGDPAMMPLNKIYAGKTKVTASRARGIAALYRSLEAQPGPCERSRRHAARNGWLPPMVWDESTIDDPDAEPDLSVLRPLRPVHGQVLEDFRIEYLDLRDHVRLSDELIAERLGITQDLLLTRLSRLGIRAQRSTQSEAVAS